MVCGKGEMNLPADPYVESVRPQVPVPTQTILSAVAQPVSIKIERMRAIDFAISLTPCWLL